MKTILEARIALAEALGAAVLTDMKTSAAFPTDHPLHPIETDFVLSAAVGTLLKEADVILSLDWIDLKRASSIRPLARTSRRAQK